MPTIVAFPGTEGSFSAAAAHEAFPNAECVPYETFQEAAGAVIMGKANYALLPVENSFAGAVLTTHSLLEKLPLHIVGERMKSIRHQLVAVPGTKIEDIQTIASHPQAISQCDAFLSTLHDVQIVPSENTAISAREVARKGDKHFAAIASEWAAELYGLEILKRDIQTSKNNTTRFFVVSLSDDPLDTPEKATVVFTVDNKVGALVQVLLSFALSGLNMSRIESRPLPDSNFLYFFSADFEGKMDSRHLERAMEAAHPFCRDLRLLGVYPKAKQE